MTFPEGLYLRTSSRQCLPFQVLLHLWISAHPAAQSLSTWERNLGMKTHQVITGTTTINYHHRLSAPDVAVFGSTPGGHRQLQAR